MNICHRKTMFVAWIHCFVPVAVIPDIMRRSPDPNANILLRFYVVSALQASTWIWKRMGILSRRVCVRTLQWRHNGRDSVSNHQPHDCLLNRWFRRRSKRTSKLRFTCFCAGNSPVPGEFPAQMASNAENVSIWWRHHLSRRVCVRRSTDLSTTHEASFNWIANRGMLPTQAWRVNV